MKKQLALFVLPLLVAGSLSPVFAPHASAVTAADWKAGRIIDDGKFTGMDMSAADIQSFLNDKVPVCDTWGTQPASEYGRSDITHAQYAALVIKDASGKIIKNAWPGPPYVCLKNYHEVPKTAPGPGVPANSYGNGGNPPAGSISAAQMIYNAAQTHRISPKVLLVKLATESAGPLTTDKWPLQKQYTYAMGAYCPDSGPGGSANCNTNYAGFSIQMSEAAELLRWYLDGMTQSWWQYKKPYQTNYVLWNVEPRGCGGSNVYLETMGTAALYTYTPYQPNQAALNNMYTTGDNCSAYGNRNFWRVYNDWFGPTTGTFLMQSPRSPAVYLVSNNTKYGVPSYEVLKAYGYDKIKVTPVSDSYLDGVSDGGTLGTTFTINGSGAVYLADNGYRFGVSSYQQCVDWGRPDCISSARNLSNGVASSILDAGSLKPLILNGSTIYKPQGGYKRPFLSWSAINENGYTKSDLTPITSPLNVSQPIGYSIFEDGAFVKFTSKPLIYIYRSGKFYQFSTYNDFTAWLPKGKSVYDDGISLYNTTPPTPVTQLNQYIFTADGKHYVLADGKKFDITSTSSNWPVQVSSVGLENEVTNLEAGALVTPSSVLRLPSGHMFKVENKTIRSFNSLYDYFASGYHANDTINIPSSAVDRLPAGPTVFANGGGSLFKINSPGQENVIYTSASNSSCYLSSLNQLSQFNFTATSTTLNASDATSNFPTSKSLSSLVRDSNSNYFLVVSGKKYPISLADLNGAWGVNSVDACGFSNYFLQRLSTSSSVGSFGRSPITGTIYYASGGAKHALSWARFIALGGSSANTIDMPEDFLNMSPTGEPMY